MFLVIRKIMWNKHSYFHLVYSNFSQIRFTTGLKTNSFTDLISFLTRDHFKLDHIKLNHIKL